MYSELILYTLPLEAALDTIAVAAVVIAWPATFPVTDVLVNKFGAAILSSE
jgi:hypothetical protein